VATEQASPVDQQAVKEPPSGSRFKQFLVPVSIAAGLIVGTTVGKKLGANYEGFGQISGARVGEWLGFGIGVSVATIVGGLFLTFGTGSRVRRIVSCFAIGFAFILSSVVAIIAEANAGELGGPLAFIAFWVLVFLIVYLAGKRSQIGSA